MTNHRSVVSAIAIFLGLALTGCAGQTSTPDDSHSASSRSTSDAQRQPARALLAQSPVCCMDLAELTYQDLTKDFQGAVHIGPGSPSFEFPSGKSFLAAFRLPANSPSLQVRLESQASGRILFPTVMLLDRDFRMTRVLGNDQFRYHPARAFKGDSIDGVFRIERPYVDYPRNEHYMLIYTTTEQMRQSTTLVHPAKAYALAHGNHPPDIPDPVLPHGPEGVVNLQIQEVRSVQLAPYQHSRSLAPLTTLPTEEAPIAKSPPPALTQPRAYYQHAVAEALDAGDLDRALQLVEEAQRVGVPEVRGDFLSRVRIR